MHLQQSAVLADDHNFDMNIRPKPPKKLEPIGVSISFPSP